MMFSKLISNISGISGIFFDSNPSVGPKGYAWQKWSGKINNLHVRASKDYLVGRGLFKGDWIPGKFNLTEFKFYVPWDGREHLIPPDQFELLVFDNFDYYAEWIPAEAGRVCDGAVGPIGNENLYVARFTNPSDNVVTPGKVDQKNKKAYITFNGKEIESINYEVLRIKSYWVYPNEATNLKLIKSSENYIVGRGWFDAQWIPGKFHIPGNRFYVPWGSTEQFVTTFQLLAEPSGSVVEWVPCSNGDIPNFAVGPVGKEGFFVGRVMCPHPENVLTPGKIDRNNRVFYLSWDGREFKHEKYEGLAIRRVI